MNEKSSIHDLIRALVERHHMETEHAGVFVQTFFELIAEGLKQDSYVKVKGLGTFKRIMVDARESVDVNTGERIEIQAHHRIVFTPEQSMRDFINKPFAHFETVPLNESTQFDDLEIGETSEEETETVDIVPVNQTVESPAKQVSEVKVPDNELFEQTTPQPTIQDMQPVVQPKIPSIDVPMQKKSTPWCLYATILFCGILVGGMVAWLLMSGRRYVLESELHMPMPTPVTDTLETHLPDDTLAVAPDTLHRDTIKTDTLKPHPQISLPATDGKEKVAEVQGQTLPTNEKQQTKPKETKADTMEYRVIGTQTTYKLREGETLVRVALKFYGSKKLWPYIVKYNASIIQDPDHVPVGTTLKIPQLVPKQVRP